MNVEHYDALAALLEYPGDDFSHRLAGCTLHVATTSNEQQATSKEHLSLFASSMQGLSLCQAQELYIKTFDFSPNCTLDLGWQLFAEDYNRGLFLVKLRSESRRLGVEQTSELPDHLPHVLRLMTRMTPVEADDFAATCGVPAVEKILAAMEADNPYRPLIECVMDLMNRHAARAPRPTLEDATPRRVSLTQLSNDLADQTETVLT